MTIGIYALFWELEDLVYVGQSGNIERRYKEHLLDLKKNKHSNYKVQLAFNTYGKPVCNVLEECSEESLNEREVFWTSEFNSCHSGLNTNEGGNAGGRGLYHSQSKFTRAQLLLVLRLLSSNHYIPKHKIAELTSVSEGMIEAIFEQRSHIWLKEEFSFRYSLMLLRKPDRVKYLLQGSKTLESQYKIIGKTVPIMISPLGEEILVSSIREFCRKNNLANSSISNIINHKQQTHRGWKLKE